MTDANLFDAAAAAAARDEAVRRADDHKSDDWRDEADAAIRLVARHTERFIVDEVWLTGLRETRENRALGARMTAAVKAGVIAPTSEYRPSDRITSHRVPRRVWRSLIYTTPTQEETE